VYRTIMEQPTRTIMHVARSGVAHILPPTGAVYAVNGISGFDLDARNDRSDDGTSTAAWLAAPLRELASQFHYSDPALPLLISDSILLRNVPCSMLAIIPPARLARTRTGSDFDCGRCCMPLPTEDEVLAMREVAFPDMPLAGVKNRMRLWGPIPRRVLMQTQHDEQVALWEQAAAVPIHTLEALMDRRFCNLEGLNGDAAQRLLLLRAPGQDVADSDPRHADYYSFYKSRTVVASPAVLRYMAERMADEPGVGSAARLLTPSMAAGSLAAWLTLAADRAVEATLAAGGTFVCREIRDLRYASLPTPCISLTLPRAPRVYFDGDAQLAALAHEQRLRVPRPGTAARGGLLAVLYDASTGWHGAIDTHSRTADEGIHAQALAGTAAALGWRPVQPTRTTASFRHFVVQPEYRFTTHQHADLDAPPEASAFARAALEQIPHFHLCLPTVSVASHLAAELAAVGVARPADILVALQPASVAAASAVVGAAADA